MSWKIRKAKSSIIPRIQKKERPRADSRVDDIFRVIPIEQ